MPKVQSEYLNEIDGLVEVYRDWVTIMEKYKTGLLQQMFV